MNEKAWDVVHRGKPFPQGKRPVGKGIFVLKSALQLSSLTFWGSIGQLSRLSPPLPPQTSVLHLPARDEAGWWLAVRSP